jgi:hypothetical protein
VYWVKYEARPGLTSPAPALYAHGATQRFDGAALVGRTRSAEWELRGVIPAFGDIDSSAPSSAPEPGAKSHWITVRFCNECPGGRSQHEAGSASFGINPESRWSQPASRYVHRGKMVNADGLNQDVMSIKIGAVGGPSHASDGRGA